MSINMQEWRDETTAIVNELLADGSNPSLDYEIEHHSRRHREDAADPGKVRRGLRRLGHLLPGVRVSSWLPAEDAAHALDR